MKVFMLRKNCIVTMEWRHHDRSLLREGTSEMKTQKKVLLQCAKHSTGSIVIHTIYVALPNKIDSVIAMESVPGLCNRKKKANL